MIDLVPQMIIVDYYYDGSDKADERRLGGYHACTLQCPTRCIIKHKGATYADNHGGLWLTRHSLCV